MVKKEKFNKRYLMYGLGAVIFVLFAVLIFVNYSSSTGEAIRKTDSLRKQMLPAYDENRMKEDTSLYSKLGSADKLVYAKVMNDLSKYPSTKMAVLEDYCLCDLKTGGGSEDYVKLCIDTDDGNDPGVEGKTVEISGNNFMVGEDSCKGGSGDSTLYTEYYCENGAIKSKSGKCEETGEGNQCNKEMTACAPQCIENEDCKRDGFIHWVGDSCINKHCVSMFNGHYKGLVCKGDSSFTPGLVSPNNNGIIKDLTKQGTAYLVYGGQELTNEQFLNLDLHPYYLTLSTKGYPFVDYCKSSSEVVKYICGNEWYSGYMNMEGYSIPAGFKDGESLIVPKTYTCPTGTSCTNGACIMNVVPMNVPLPK